MSQRANIADIICIGAQRAMTSWLHHVLAAHPRFWAFPDFNPVTSTRKEAHFWDWNRARGIDWYRFLLTPPDPGQLSMDFTPDYALLSDEQITECKALNPDARVIYILRDPLARAISTLRMHLMWRLGSSDPGAGALALDDTLHDLIRQSRLWSHGDMVGNLMRWRRHYPDMLVVHFESLATDTDAELARIFAHCATTTDGLPPDTTAEIAARAGRIIWETPRYAVSSDALWFLHGATDAQRQACAATLGLEFTEGQRVLAGAAP
jgi:hypothetical protein